MLHRRRLRPPPVGRPREQPARRGPRADRPVRRSAFARVPLPTGPRPGPVGRICPSTRARARPERSKSGKARSACRDSTSKSSPASPTSCRFWVKRASMKTRVGILTGSPSDLEVVKKAAEVLEQLGVGCEVKVLSAHRTPERVMKYVTEAPGRGIEVLIACAGMAAHLAGVVAAHTLLPVIGVPLASGALQGVDALLATVQMPPGIPVATVGVDGAK